MASRHRLRTGRRGRSPLDHVQSRAQRSLGVVFVGNRRPEQGQQRVTDELVDETSKVLHRCRQLLEQFVLKVRISSGSSCSLNVVKPLRSANSTVTVRRSASVSGLRGLEVRTAPTAGSAIGSRDGCRPEARSRGCARSFSRAPVDLGATSWTKCEIRRAGIAAASTEIWLLRSAFGAEGKTALDFETATAAVHRSQPRGESHRRDLPRGRA